MNKGDTARIINGFELLIARSGVILTIIWIAFRQTMNPVRAYTVLKSLALERKSIHQNKGEFKAVKAGGKYYWSVNLPGWPSHNFNATIRNEVEKKLSSSAGKLQTMILGITNKCPLGCKHCYEWDNLSAHDSLSFSDLQLIIEKIRKAGINHIHFGGGEPLARFDDMIALMDHSGNSCDYWINTSGFGLTKEKARIMKEHGMTGAIISLDDWDENRHNSFRNNQSSFDWVMKAARNCTDAGIIVCLSLCPMKHLINITDLDKYHKLAKELGASFVRIIEPMKAGRFRDYEEMPDDEQLSLIAEFMRSRNSDPDYRDYPVIQFPGHHARQTGCTGSGNRYMYIDPNGNFHTCPFCRNPLGNVLNETIESGRQKAIKEGCHAFNIRKTTNSI